MHTTNSLRIALLAGWDSDEREISLKSGTAVEVALAQCGHRPLHLDPAIDAPARVFIMAAVIRICWPAGTRLWPVGLSSVVIGVAVFFLWIAPDHLISGYRDLWPFHNGIVGKASTSIPSESLLNPWVLGWRTVRAVVIVPIVEELFWRAWLMRWLIDRNFNRIPLGTYAPAAFWITAVLFAVEHGPYWDVGLLTGIIYNWWMIRTKSVADCILMHAVTNACLSAYVIATGQWQYWL